MTKKILIGLGVGCALYYAYYLNKDKFGAKAQQFIKENFSIRIAGAKVHRLDKSGLDFRLTADLINLSSISATAKFLKADIYFLKNGSPSHLATTAINNSFTIKAQNTTRISDFKVQVPYASLIWNMSLFTAAPRQFKVVITTNVNGQDISLTKNIIA
ncbi:MAG: hypothetical protein N4A71_11065 [Carboxylicivirga sp.]|jgi:hypothetical protein|nr:hypothetical protein [Carboxylicivirga sp.]